LRCRNPLKGNYIRKYAVEDEPNWTYIKKAQKRQANSEASRAPSALGAMGNSGRGGEVEFSVSIETT
jgi:hypothetical protein